MTKRKKKQDKIIAVCGTKVLAWVNGTFAGDSEFLALVRASIEDNSSIWLGKNVTCSSETPEGALAAMLTVENVKIVEAPYVLLTAYELRRSALGVHNV
jgi:hypothetical protein